RLGSKYPSHDASQDPISLLIRKHCFFVWSRAARMHGPAVSPQLSALRSQSDPGRPLRVTPAKCYASPPMRRSWSVQEHSISLTILVTLRSAFKEPSAIEATIRGDTNARGAKNRM